METVVEVGRPKTLNTLMRITSVIMTAQKIYITSRKVKSSGWNMPERAISIIPEEKVAPKSTPSDATIKITLSGAIRLPTAEFKKLTASLDTPTNRSIHASKSKKPTSTMKIISVISYSGNCPKTKAY